MICAVIKGPSYSQAYLEIKEAVKKVALLEIRFDSFEEIDENFLLSLQHLRVPMIFTLRSKNQGGAYAKTENDRLKDLKRLASFNPEFLDIEDDVPLSFFQEIKKKNPRIKLLVSHHDCTKTPAHLEVIYNNMKKFPADVYKIAVYAHSSLDVLRLLQIDSEKLIKISMGPYGSFARILSPLDQTFTYAFVSESHKTATGQLSVESLKQTYGYENLSSTTRVYALIGDPVELSVSHETHNAVFRTFHIDAVYVKIPLKVEEIQKFLEYARKMPFKGLSVTMPLKEAIIPYLDEIDSEALKMGAVNTITFEKGIIKGFNTDGRGAMKALERVTSLENKRVIIIGSGGAAKAIAYKAKEKKALVTIVSRNKNKAKELADDLDCQVQALDSIKAYDILINATPSLMPIDDKSILSKTIVMESISNPMKTTFIQMAEQKNCSCVYGYQMFVEQAVLQFTLWFKEILDVRKLKEVLEKKTLECLK